MKELIAQTLTTVCLVAVLFSAIFALGYGLYLWGKKESEQAKEYEDMYDWIQGSIDYYAPNIRNYEALYARFEKPLSLPYKNPEKTGVLFDQFMRKFQGVADKKVAEVIKIK